MYPFCTQPVHGQLPRQPPVWLVTYNCQRSNVLVGSRLKYLISLTCSSLSTVYEMSAKMFDGAVTKDSESSDTGNPFDFDDDEDEEEKDKTPASGAPSSGVPSVSPFAAAATTPVAQNADKSPDTNDAPSRMNFSIRNVMNVRSLI